MTIFLEYSSIAEDESIRKMKVINILPYPALINSIEFYKFWVLKWFGPDMQIRPCIPGSRDTEYTTVNNY